MENEIVQTEPESERVAMKLCFDHTKENIFEAMGFPEKEGEKFVRECAEKFNQKSSDSHSLTELIEYAVNLESKEELASILFGIITTTNQTKMKCHMLEMLLKASARSDE